MRFYRSDIPGRHSKGDVVMAPELRLPITGIDNRQEGEMTIPAGRLKILSDGEPDERGDPEWIGTIQDGRWVQEILSWSHRVNSIRPAGPDEDDEEG